MIVLRPADRRASCRLSCLALAGLMLLLVLGFAPLRLFAVGQAPQTFTDTDGDTYVVSLRGPGSVAVTRAGTGESGPIASLALTGTTVGSSVKVTVRASAGGDGKVQIGHVSGAGSLGSLLAPKSDLDGAGITLGGRLGKLSLANIADGAVIQIGRAPKGPSPTQIIAGRIGAATIRSEGTLAALTAREVAGALIEAPAIGIVTVTAGSLDATLNTPGKLAAVLVKGGNLSGRIHALSIGPISVARNRKTLAGGSILNATIAAAQKIGGIRVQANIVDSLVLAGATLGADGALGGTGADADHFAGGSIKSLRVGGNISGSIIGAGLSPFDGVFRDDNDGIFGLKRSRLGSLTIAGQLSDDSRVGAGAFGRVKISGARVRLPQLDPRFVSRRLEGVPPPAPNPAKSAPLHDQTVATNLADSTKFLYLGSNPIQTGVVPGVIAPDRAAVLRGRVLARDGTALPSVTVSILGRPEFGETLSRADGWFDLVVNGGGLLNMAYERPGFLTAQRQADVAIQDYTSVPDVVLAAVDPIVTTVAFGAEAPPQIHEASMQTDADGQRHATLMFQPGTAASLIMPDGTTEPMTSLKIRATEFTVGPNGARAMPAPLPPTSAYTYCAEFSADEAQAVGAVGIQFDRPVWFYVENFLGFPAGTDVPMGYFNEQKGQWEPIDSGLVIKIVSITDGTAGVDVTGDNVADNDAVLGSLGFTDLERQQLASRYAAGQSLWRAPLPHFSKIDANWPGSPGNPAGAPNGPKPKPKTPPDKVDDPPNVYIQNQVLGESLSIAGTPFSLNYRSNRVSGYRSGNQVEIALSGASLVGAVLRIDLEVAIAGRVFTQQFAPAPNLVTTFEWDGRDAYGRDVHGVHPATIRISNVYRGAYMGTRRFGYQGEFELTGNSTRNETAVAAIYQVQLGSLDVRRQSVGGWTLDVHHIYDPIGRVLYEGDGSTRSVQNINHVVETFAGTGVAGFSGDGGPATAARLNRPSGVAVGADGSVYIADTDNRRLRKVDANGVITTIAGNGQSTSAGDGGAALQASFNAPDLSLAQDGSIYLSDNLSRIRRIGPDGIIHTIAGTGVAGSAGDNGPALAATIFASAPRVAADGTVYFPDADSSRVRRITTDGIISRVTGSAAGFTGDNGPAINARVNQPVDMVIGPDGSLFIGDTFNDRIRRIAPNGIITTYGGIGTADGQPNDGGPATAAKFRFRNFIGSGTDMAIAPDGTVFFTERDRGVIRKITPDGIVNNFAGTGTRGFSGDGGPANQAQFDRPVAVAVGPDGSVYCADNNTNRVRRIRPPLPGFTSEEIGIPSGDGTELHRFDRTGRHLETRHAFTGAVLYKFDYSAAGQLAKITDAFGNVTTIERTPAGAPTGILAPFGQRTRLTTDENHCLTSIKDPAGGTYTFVSNAGGLITSETDPNGNHQTFTYGADGRLLRYDSPGATVYDLERVDLANGYIVSASNALHSEGSYKIERTTKDEELRTNTDSAGLVATELNETSGRTISIAPDGTTLTSISSGDRRFGFLAPVPTSSVTVTPSGKTFTLQTARSIEGLDGNDPLEFTTWTETSTRNGRNYTNTFDRATRVFQHTTPVGRQVRREINEQGQTVRLEIGSLAPKVLTYDARGLLAQETAGTGENARIDQFTRNAAGFIASRVDPLQRVTSYAHDAAGRRIQSTLPGNRVLKSAYDGKGNLLSLTTPANREHTFAYTDFDETASYTAPSVGTEPAVTSFEYDAVHRLTRVIKPGDVEIGVTYDAAGRLASRATATGAIAFTYHPTNGQLTQIAGPAESNLTFSYDGSIPLGTTWSGPVNGSVSRAIDNDLRTASDTVAIGAFTSTVAFTYDNDSRLTGAGALTLTRSNVDGFVTAASIGGLAETFDRNEFGEIIEHRAEFGGATLFQQTVARDKLGRIIGKTETISGATDTFTYAYDIADRLSEVSKNGNVIASYAYDIHDNRITANGVGAAHDAQDRLTSLGAVSYGYTPAGYLASRGADTYAYDADGNLLSATVAGLTVSYAVDGANRRVARTAGSEITGFLYDGQFRIAAVIQPSGEVIRYVYAHGGHVPAYMEKTGASYRLLTDRNGSVRLVVDVASGSIAQRIDYSPFGEILFDSNPGFQPLGFAGGLHDPITGLIRFGFRDYDPRAGRWTAKDPLLFGGGDTNLYAYAGNDPVNFIDPQGLAPSKGLPQNDVYGEILLALQFLALLNGELLTAEEAGSKFFGPGYKCEGHRASKERERARNILQEYKEELEGDPAFRDAIEKFIKDKGPMADQYENPNDSNRFIPYPEVPRPNLEEQVKSIDWMSGFSGRSR